MNRVKGLRMKRLTFRLFIALVFLCSLGALIGPIPVSGQTIHQLQCVVVKGQFLGPTGKSIHEYDYLEPGFKYRLLPKSETHLSTLDGKKNYIAVGPGILSFDPSGPVYFNGKTQIRQFL